MGDSSGEASAERAKGWNGNVFEDFLTRRKIAEFWGPNRRTVYLCEADDTPGPDEDPDAYWTLTATRVEQTPKGAVATEWMTEDGGIVKLTDAERIVLGLPPSG